MKKYVIGADIGGTTVKLGIMTVAGEVVKKWEIPTRTANGGKAICPDMAASVKEELAGLNIEISEVEGIGLGVPGSVRPDQTVDICVNLGWKNKDAKGEMEALLGIPAAVGNDANMAALGEMWQGGGKGYDNQVFVTLGTGVGGGIINDGKLVTGGHGYGGEIGHMIINPKETVACNCGKCGCLEQYCSATGIVRMTKDALAQPHAKTMLDDVEEISARSIFDAAKAGDELALNQVEDFCQRLAMGLSFISGVTDPSIIVIGGGVSKAGNIIVDNVAKYFTNYVFGLQKETKFALATLGNDAGMYGCAKLILNR